ncbi:TolC family protein [Campylobacter pinnipediorum]|uniref:TolC family protein n=2 Tax=Campylobacter pinnipediorum TaxID=1965231 RepID=UPI00099546EA|nr:TolC family protein [Campylobacter pinnipediorum]
MFAKEALYDYEYLLNKAKKDSPTINIKKLDIKIAKEDTKFQKADFYPRLLFSALSQYSDTFDKNYNSIHVRELTSKLYLLSKSNINHT